MEKKLSEAEERLAKAKADLVAAEAAAAEAQAVADREQAPRACLRSTARFARALAATGEADTARKLLKTVLPHTGTAHASKDTLEVLEDLGLMQQEGN